MIELVELREERTKHFRVGYDDEGNEMRRSYTVKVPMHYRTPMGWKDIKPEWKMWGLDGVGYFSSLCGLGCTQVRLLDGGGSPSIEGHRVWWRGIAPQTDAVLIASATRLQLHLILHGPRAPRTWRFWMATPEDREIGGRDNINKLYRRPGTEQHYELEIEHSVSHHVVTKTWTGRVKAVDPVTRVKSWSDDPIWPVRII